MDSDFAFQIRVWGAAWCGNVLEIAALHAEGRGPSQKWDRTAKDLARGGLFVGDTRQDIPYRYALPYLTEWMLRLNDNIYSEHGRQVAGDANREVFGEMASLLGSTSTSSERAREVAIPVLVPPTTNT